MTTDELAAGRRVELEGTPNCRDLGGYRSSDGRSVRWGYLFRSGQLSQLTERDRERLASLQLDVVIDLRREEEQDNDPSRTCAYSFARLLNYNRFDVQHVVNGSNRVGAIALEFEIDGSNDGELGVRQNAVDLDRITAFFQYNPARAGPIG